MFSFKKKNKEKQNLHIEIGSNVLEVYHEDLSSMGRDEAVLACDDLGSDWRVPTMDELSQIKSQLHTKGLGDFQNTRYIADDGSVFFGEEVGVLRNYNPKGARGNGLLRPVRNQ